MTLGKVRLVVGDRAAQLAGAVAVEDLDDAPTPSFVGQPAAVKVNGQYCLDAGDNV
jgi:hypothetical protein